MGICLLRRVHSVESVHILEPSACGRLQSLPTHRLRTDRSTESKSAKIDLESVRSRLLLSDSTTLTSHISAFACFSYELLSEPVDKAVVADAHVKLARTHLRGKGMSMAKITDDSHSHQLYKLGDLVDRGVVHYHKRYRASSGTICSVCHIDPNLLFCTQVHNWVQWLRARVTSIYTNDDGEQTHVDVEVCALLHVQGTILVTFLTSLMVSVGCGAPSMFSETAKDGSP